MREGIERSRNRSVELLGGVLLCFGLAALPFAVYEGFEPRIHNEYAACSKDNAPHSEALASCTDGVADRVDFGKGLAIASTILTVTGGGFVGAASRIRRDS